MSENSRSSAAPRATRAMLEHDAQSASAASTPAHNSKKELGSATATLPAGARLTGAEEKAQRTSERRTSSGDSNTACRQTRGPRSLFLRRSDNGFGFTLRHFIVYPPESYSVLAGDRSLGLRHGPGHRLDEPMDTIFVKHVREKSAAHIAGLSTGDRIICVNGQSIAGLSYAQVVQLIQQSGSYLHLLVVPREDDLLQLYFAETAHNPYTNQRPWEIHQQDIYPDQGMKPRSTRHSSPSKSSTMLTYPANSPAHRDVGGTLTGRILDTRSLTRTGSGSRRSSEGSVSGNQCRTCGTGHSTSFNNGHAPILFPCAATSSLQGSDSLLSHRRGSSVERVLSSSNSDDKRRESTASLPLNVSGGGGTSDSSPRLSIASSIDPSEADSVITRIKKSFEQKEEFLKRPNQPIWLPSSSSSSSSTSSTCSVTSSQQQQQQQQTTTNNLIPREFYAHPQKFSKPLWPPQQNGADSNGNAEEEDQENHYETDTISLKAQFMCGGPVTNVTPPKVTPSSDGTSLRPLATSSPLRTHHAHTTSPRPFVSTLGRITENQTTMSPVSCEVPVSPLAQTVSRRARQFESGQVEEDKTVLYRSELARLSAKKSVPDVAHRKQEFESKSKSLDSTGLPRSPPPRICQKPPKPPQRRVKHEVKEEAASPPVSPTPVPYITPLSGNCLIPVGGRYVAYEPDAGWLEDTEDTVTEPPPAVPPPDELPAPRSRSNSVESWAPLVRQSSTREKRQSLTSSTAEEGTPRPVRPTHLSLQNPVRPPSPPHASTAESVHLPRGAAPEPPEAAHTLTEAAQGRGDVTAGVQMRRPRHSVESDAERAVRRESYLKATWAERMHVDSDASEDDHAHQPGSPAEDRPSLSRLRSMFAERAAASDSTARQANSEHDGGVLREGWLHCKLSLQDGKRAADRSWKQVWAVLRGNTLHLRKERRDNTGHHSTPGHGASSGEEQTVPLRGCLVDAAADYTKKKHVLRLHTPAGSQLLLQAEDPLDMAKWLQLLRPRAQEGSSEESVHSKHASEPPLSPGVVHGSNSPPRLSPQPAHKGIRKLTTSFRNRSPTGQSPVNKTRKPSQHEPLASPKSKTWKGRVAKQLRKIQGTSPSSPTAPYPEGATIGVPLEFCPSSSYCEFVPLLVELCTGIVEERGLDIIGIYRVPGNTAAVTSLTEAVNKGFDSINLQDPRWNDVNVISSLLKSFFRKLPDSLFTSELYPLFINSDKVEDPNARFRRIRKLVRELPEHHYETLRCLMAHLNKVVQHCASNKMEARNLAIVFGPTLLRASDDNMVAMVTDMPHQCRIVESLISHAEWFFSDEEDSDDLVTPSLPSSSLSDAADNSAADAANHSLLLNNIHKVEGYNSPSKDISAKDIVSSIISAANKKMQKAKTRRGLRLNSEDTPDSRDDEKVGEKSRSNTGGRDTSSNADQEPAPTPSTSAAPDTPSMSVASSILSSVLFSGNIVKSIHGPAPPTTEATPPPQSAPVEQRPYDGATIHTYAGLSANTQERIRRFEQETRAMLTTSKARSEAERREMDKQRIELEWQQAKQELESDILDEIGDTTVELRKHVSESGSPLLRLSSKPPVMPSRPSSAQPLSPPAHPTALAVLSSLRAIRRGNSAENIAALCASEPQKPLSLIFDTNKVAPNGTLKRLKTGKEQAEPLSPSPLGSLRCGSLDSLHDAFLQEPKDRPRSGASDDGHDLLTSLTSTFDKKMRSLKAEEVTPTEEKDTTTTTTTSSQVQEENKVEEVRPYRDPSLHRAKPKVTESPPANSQDCGSKVTVRIRDKDNSTSRSSRKRDSGSGDRRSSTGGSGLSKIEKEARNNSVISPTNSSTSLLLARLKRKSAMHLQRGIKRRHTVGGCKDLARLGWENEVPNNMTEGPVLSEAQQQAALRCWLQRGRLRSSSPELSPRTAAAAGLLLLAAAELSQAVNRKPKPAVSSPPDILAGLGNIPLESHV